MAAWRSSLDSGAHSVVGYYRDHTAGVRVTIMINIRSVIVIAYGLGYKSVGTVVVVDILSTSCSFYSAI